MTYTKFDSTDQNVKEGLSYSSVLDKIGGAWPISLYCLDYSVRAWPILFYYFWITVLDMTVSFHY